MGDTVNWLISKLEQTEKSIRDLEKQLLESIKNSTENFEILDVMHHAMYLHTEYAKLDIMKSTLTRLK